MSNFNLDSLSFSETTELQLRHPVTEELLWADKEQTEPVAIALHGTSSKKYRNAITAMQNRQLKRQQTKQKVNAETLREESISLLIACSERGVNMDYAGAALDNEDAFRTLYSDPKMSWVKDQVDAALGDPANFLAL